MWNLDEFSNEDLADLKKSIRKAMDNRIMKRINDDIRYRTIATEFGISLGTITKIYKRSKSQ